MAKIIVFGNEKGGSGKSTTAIHVAIALCYQNKNVGIIDLDIRQKSMFRFLENRSDFCKKQNYNLPRPTFYKIDQSNKDEVANTDTAFVANGVSITNQQHLDNGYANGNFTNQ